MNSIYMNVKVFIFLILTNFFPDHDVKNGCFRI